MAAKQTSKQRTSGLTVERLEGREVPAVSATLSAGVLYLNGTNGADYAYVKPTSTLLQVTTRTGTEASVVRNYNASSVTRIEFRGYAGNDRFVNDAYKPVRAYGDSGNDYLEGANAADTMYGGNDNDSLYGYGGNDWLYGGAGRDYLYGSSGNDNLYGEAGDDWLQGDSGKDRFNGGDGWDRYKDQTTTFVNGVSLNDIQQQESGVCTILAQVGATIGYTVRGETWLNRVQYVDSSTYRVKLYSNGSPYWEYVNFSGWWGDDDAAARVDATGETYEAWVVVVLRAVLDNYGIPWQTQYASNWPLYGGNWMTCTRALPVITGDTHPTYERLESWTQDTPQALRQRWLNYFVVAESESCSGTYIPGTTIVGSHAYTVTNVYQSGSTWYVQVYNPWGSDAYTSNGFQTLTWSKFYTAFYGYGY